jgi:hypothetical protein
VQCGNDAALGEFFAEGLETLEGGFDAEPVFTVDGVEEEFEIEADGEGFGGRGEHESTVRFFVEKSMEVFDALGRDGAHLGSELDAMDSIAKIANINEAVGGDDGVIGERAVFGFPEDDAPFGFIRGELAFDGVELLCLAENGLRAYHVDHLEWSGFPSESPLHDSVEVLNGMADGPFQVIGVSQSR